MARMQTVWDQLNNPDLKPGDPSPGVIRCAHFFKSGRQCPREAAASAAVCVIHGANIREASESQQRQLLAAQQVAIDVTEELMVCAVDERVRLNAALAILDRTGLGPKSTLTVDDKREDLSSLSWQELTAESERLGQLAREELHRQHTHSANLSVLDGDATSTKH